MIASLGSDARPLPLSPSSLYFWQLQEDIKEPVTLVEKSRGRRPHYHGLSECAIIGLGGRGVIKTWTEATARVRLYMLTSDLTSLVPSQISHWLQVRKVGTVYFILFYLFLFKQETRHIAPLCPMHPNPHSYPNLFLTTRAERSAGIGNFQQHYMSSESIKRLLMI